MFDPLFEGELESVKIQEVEISYRLCTDQPMQFLVEVGPWRERTNDYRLDQKVL
jgi:hypothetical protein